jgi:hypothetical protein
VVKPTLKLQSPAVYDHFGSPGFGQADNSERIKWCLVTKLSKAFPSPTRPALLKGHGDTVTAVALTRDGKRAVSGSPDD